MLRIISKLGAVLLAVLIVPVMAACSTDADPTATSIPAEPVANVAISDAWARPAAMLAGEMEMEMENDSMSMSLEDDESMSGMDMGDDSMAMSHGPAGATGAVYFVMINSGNADDTLVEVTKIQVDSARDLSDIVELHESSMTDGVMRMEKLDAGIQVPAGQTVELKPGGLHVMMMNTKRDLTPGDEITLGLRFESGSEQTVVAEVREP